MSILHPSDIAPETLEDQQFVGTVINNKDPLKMRRIQVMIEPIWGKVPVAELPWCRPCQTTTFGGVSTAGFFVVPNEQSQVVIILQKGDPSFPEYVADFISTANTIPLFSINYPTRYGFTDEQGTYFVVDRTAGTVEFYHKSGTSFTIDSAGDVTTDVVGNYTATIKGNLQATVEGTTTVNSTGTATITAPVVLLGNTSSSSSDGVVRFSDLSNAITNHTHPDPEGGNTGNGSGTQTASSVVFSA